MTLLLIAYKVDDELHFPNINNSKKFGKSDKQNLFSAKYHDKGPSKKIVKLMNYRYCWQASKSH